MFKKDVFLEYYFRSITILFWAAVIYNWIFISHMEMDLSIFKFYVVFSTIYLATFSIYELKNKNYITYFYRAISTITFTISLLYLLIMSNSLSLLFIKSIMILIYFYASYLKVFVQKDEEGVVGIIGAILLFIFGIYY